MSKLTKEQDKVNPDAIKTPDGKEQVPAGLNYEAMGKTDGNVILGAIRGAQSTCRSTLCERAESFAGNDDHISKWLSGYGEVMGKTKKSEASTVFKAYAANSLSVLGFDGVYNDWITHCRTLKNEGTSITTRATRTPTISDKGMEKVVEGVAVMNAGQVKVLLDKAYSQLKATGGENWEPSFLTQIDELANMLQTSKQPFFIDMGKAIQAVGAAYLTEKADAAAKQAAARKEKQDANIGVIPPAPLGVVIPEVVELQQAAA